MSADIESIIRVSRKAIAQDEHTPEHERMSCRRLLELALPFLERARIAEELYSILTASSREEAATIRDRVIFAAQRGERPKSDWDLVCEAVTDRWGEATIGTATTGRAFTGD